MSGLSGAFDEETAARLRARVRWRRRHAVMKVCGACGEVKPSSAYARDSTRSDALRWRCRACGS